MGYYFADGATFLVQTLFDLFVIALILRLLFQVLLTRADYNNPLWQAVVKVTGPVLHPLRRLIPGFKGIDIATILAIVIFKMLEILVLRWIMGDQPGIAGVLVLSVAEVLQTVIYIFLFVIFVGVLLSWVGGGSYNAFTSVIYGLSEPVLQPLRDMLPPLGGLDLSPIVMFIILNLSAKMLVAPLIDIAISLM